MTTETASPVVRMSKRRLDALINREARRRLGMSGPWFRRRLREGTLSMDKVAVRDIAMLVTLATPKNGRTGHS